MLHSQGAPGLLERWLAIIGLIAAADCLSTRRTGAWAALSLVSADAAIEAMLELAATTTDNPPGIRAQWDDIYLGTVSLYGHGRAPGVERKGAIAVDAATAEWAVFAVADAIFRLSQAGSIDPGPPPWNRP
jgi:hypothetical protein